MTDPSDHVHHVHHEGYRQRIGYAECVDLPQWGVSGLRAKVDTGARSSALHVDAVERLPGGRVRFDVVLNRRTDSRVRVTTKLERVAHVRSSSGESEERYFVSTELRIGGVAKTVEISLAARHSMRFRMLLGRTALAHDFLIDAGRSYVTGRRPTRKKRKKAKTRKNETRRTQRR